jgi:regulator of sirC expression with transglutaminase-like and TPR domain
MTTEVPPSRIAALVRLLGDDDPKILKVAWDHLEQIGEAALPEIERASQSADDTRVRVQSGRFLKEWSRREVFRRWVDFCKGTEIDLEEGAFLIAQSEYPDIDVEKYRRDIESYAQILRGRLAVARSTEDAVRKVSILLFHELGFRGDTKEFYNPENSYINRVLDLKRGIPISLATVYLLTARRVAVPVKGVGMPQRFLLKYKSSAHEVFVDVFNSGSLLTGRDCARLLADAKIPFHEDHLRSVTDREILARTLGNLLRIYHSRDDPRRCDRVTAMLKLIS